MTMIIRRLDWRLVILSVTFALGVLVGASSKSNRPLTSTLSSNKIDEVGIDTLDSNSTEIDSDTITKLKDTDSEITRKKKKRSSNTNGSSKRSSLGGTSTSIRRIKKEYKDAVDMGIAYDWVNQRHIKRKTKTKEGEQCRNHGIMCLGPMTTNLREWHFSFWGAGDGFYSEGIYHGAIVLPKDYPLSPPSVQMWTPSGRFVPGTDICLSASNYHPESWTPRWSIQGIVNALRLHMLNPPNEIGGMQSTSDETMEFARRSRDWKVSWRAKDNKGPKITVDHRLLVREGVLIDRTNDEDGDEMEEDDLLWESDLDEEVVETPKKADATKTSRKKVAKKKGEGNKSQVGLNRFEKVTSIFQLAILYMVVFFFLKR